MFKFQIIEWLRSRRTILLCRYLFDNNHYYLSNKHGCRYTCISLTVVISQNGYLLVALLVDKAGI